MTDLPPQLSRPQAYVARIEFARPNAANRIEPQDLEVLAAHLDACEADADLHVLVLAARGRHFSAGFDLRALEARVAAGGPAAAVGDAAFEAVADRLAASRLVTLAAIQGPVIGGATDLALACDLRLGSDAATMHMPAARFGLPLYASALQRYVDHFGLAQAKRLVLTAPTLDAREMLAIGMLTERCEPESLAARVDALASTVAAMPPGPLAAMKRALNAAAHGRAGEHRDALLAAYDGAAIVARVQAARRST